MLGTTFVLASITNKTAVEIAGYETLLRIVPVRCVVLPTISLEGGACSFIQEAMLLCNK